MFRDHSKLICDIGELAALFSDTSNLDTLLQKIVDMIAVHMSADVCSVYLFNDDTQEIVLKATRGLNAASIGQVRMKLGEGLTGTALAELRTVYEGNASAHPGFRHFSGIGEEKYASFMAVPILRGQVRIGVMTLQSVKANSFTPEDVNVFRAITSQLATTIEMARLLISLDKPVTRSVRAPELKFIKGRTGAEGFAYGEVVIAAVPSMDDIALGHEGRVFGLVELQHAVSAAEAELKAMQQEIEAKLFDVASLIFSAQIMMLKDRAMLGAMETLIAQGVSADQAVRRVIKEYAARFESMPNEFIREKKYDVLDVGQRILVNLTGVRSSKDQIAGKVVIARDLLPSDALKLSSQRVAGVVLLSGGVTSHVAVLARSLNIPLVIVDEPGLLELPAETKVLVDGTTGNVYVAPEAEIVNTFREKEASRLTASKVKKDLKEETFTKDGQRVTLLANINLLGDVPVAKDFRAEGVGLYRTEFPFIIRSDFPAEEEQFVIYRRLVESMKGHEITFRTLDIGGDKMLSYYDHSKEANPFLGLRSIRFSLRHKDVFCLQLRAILRAGAFADRPVRIMFPMISSVDELTEAKALVEECVHDLKKARIAHQAAPVIGIMVELPSAVEVIEALAEEAAFFSIGTNDLIQYTLAVDRTNEKVADLYVPHHPAVLRILKRIATAGAIYGRDVSVCGDMAHDLKYIPFLIGIGIRKLSLDARFLPRVQARIMELDSKEAARHARELLSLSRIDDVTRVISALMPA